MTKILNEEMALTIANTNNLPSALKVEFEKMINIYNSIESKTWDATNILNNILVKELYKDLYDSENAFAKGCGIAQPLLPRAKGAIQVRNAFKKMDIDITKAPTLLTTNKAYRLYAVIDNLGTFINYAGSHDVDIYKANEEKLADIIKHFKAYVKNNFVEPTETPESDTDEKPPVEDMVKFTLSNKSYCVPLRVLKKYEVANEDVVKTIKPKADKPKADKPKTEKSKANNKK